MTDAIAFILPFVILAIPLGLIIGIILAVWALFVSDSSRKKLLKKIMWWILLTPLAALVSIIVLKAFVVLFIKTFK